MCYELPSYESVVVLGPKSISYLLFGQIHLRERDILCAATDTCTYSSGSIVSNTVLHMRK